jgi:hypothetical protein
MQDRRDSMALRLRLEELRAENPHKYPRDYAAVLGITEAELTPLFYGGRAQAAAQHRGGSRVRFRRCRALSSWRASATRC